MSQVINYGSALQTYATQKLIESLGHQCVIINYRFPNEYHYQHGAIQHSVSWLGRISMWLGLRPRSRKRLRLLKFLKSATRMTKQYDSPSELKNCPPNCDIFVAGSDQVWNPKYIFDDYSFLLDFVPNGKRRISLSSSFSVFEIPKEKEMNYISCLNRFDAISVREESGVEIVKKLTGRDAIQTLDPTMILPSAFWSKFADTSTRHIIDAPYILVYILTYAVKPSGKIANILDLLHKKTGFKVVQVGDECKEYGFDIDLPAVGPVEFVRLFRDATIVVTSSFHGTAFALNFGRPLISLYDKTADDRMMSLLSELHVEGCACEINSDDMEWSPYYDKEAEQRELETIREHCMQFLKDNIV